MAALAMTTPACTAIPRRSMRPATAALQIVQQGDHDAAQSGIVEPVQGSRHGEQVVSPGKRSRIVAGHIIEHGAQSSADAVAGHGSADSPGNGERDRRRCGTRPMHGAHWTTTRSDSRSPKSDESGAIRNRGDHTKQASALDPRRTRLSAQIVDIPVDNYAPQAVSRVRPLRRRALTIALPLRVPIRARKPCFLDLFLLFG